MPTRSILIAYTSKYGTTADCAAILDERLSESESGQATIRLLDLNVEPIPALDDYDTVIIGSSIYVGKISKPAKAFVTDNAAELLSKRIGIFLCCGFIEEANKLFKENFSEKLLRHATVTGIFGGEARLDKMNFVDRNIMKAVSKASGDDATALSISKEAIDDFATALQ